MREAEMKGISDIRSVGWHVTWVRKLNGNGDGLGMARTKVEIKN